MSQCGWEIRNMLFGLINKNPNKNWINNYFPRGAAFRPELLSLGAVTEPDPCLPSGYGNFLLLLKGIATDEVLERWPFILA